LNHSQIVSFLWGVADLIRDTFKRGKYQDVILPLTVLRRLDCVLAPTKDSIVRHLDDQTVAIDGLIKTIREGIDRLTEFRTALISAAVTGKIDVRDETV